jgi:hypothetical protein
VRRLMERDGEEDDRELDREIDDLVSQVVKYTGTDADASGCFRQRAREATGGEPEAFLLSRIGERDLALGALAKDAAFRRS